MSEVFPEKPVVDWYASEPVKDNRPHSRACGITPHPHGMACAEDCPTCTKPTFQEAAVDPDSGIPYGQQSPPGEWVAPPNPEHHPCVLPDFTFADAGRPWKCKECGAEWRLLRDHSASHLEGAVRALKDQVRPQVTLPSYVGPQDPLLPVQPPLQVVPVPDNDRYRIDLEAPKAPKPTPADANLTLVSDHALDCAHRVGTGMCSCEQRKNL